MEKKIKWQPIVKARTSVLFQWYIFEGHKEKYFKDSLNIKASLLNGKIVSDEIFIDLNEWAKLEKTLTSVIESDETFLKKFVNLCYRYSDELIETSKKIGSKKDLLKMSDSRLFSFYKKYHNSVLKLMPFMNGVLIIDSILKKKIVQLLKNDLGGKDKKEQDLLLSKLVIPKKKSFFVQETESLLKIALKLQKDKSADVEKEIQAYLEKFSWMPSIAYLGKFQTKQGVLEKIDELLKENLQNRLKKSEQIKSETQESYQRAFKQIKTSPRLVKLIDLAREFIYLQTYRMDVFFLAYYYAYPFLEATANRCGLQVSEFVYLTGNEIIDLLKGKTQVNKVEIKDRISDYALIEENGQYTLLSGKRVKKAIPQVIKETTVEGTVANRGRATGKARLVYEVEDISKVNKDDIIVSPMTHPKLVPAIVKASGIITDFGGMLCHAAIVSREFGIPCIVGTKKATKVFKDGDLVELNAYVGVARKIKVDE